jgi:hypothetical protein
MGRNGKRTNRSRQRRRRQNVGSKLNKYRKQYLELLKVSTYTFAQLIISGRFQEQNVLKCNKKEYVDTSYTHYERWIDANDSCMREITKMRKKIKKIQSNL